MSRRLKVLLSAYACRPGHGSDSGTGWGWSLQMARLHDVTVLTRAANRRFIQPYLEAQPTRAPVPEFRYLEDSILGGACRRWLPGGPWWNYQHWQRDARRVIARLHGESRFHLLHHVTWASFRSTPAIWGQGVPAVWGPLAGAAATPWSLLPWQWPGECLHETARNLSNRVSRAYLARAGKACDAILVSTRETKAAFDDAGVPARLVPETGFSPTSRPEGRTPHAPLRLIFSGRLIFCKGLHFALRALSSPGVHAELHIFGDGPMRRGWEALSRRLALGSRVVFHGWVTRERVLASLPDFDVFLFPSLHDGTASAMLEAMAAGLPLICLDCGGPSAVVNETCGRRVPVGSLPEIVRGLTEAVAAYERDPQEVLRHGLGAWERLRRDYDWEKLGVMMDEVYQQATRRKE